MTDSELVKAIQAGDRGAFGLLMDRYRDLVWGVCHRLAGNPRDAEELAHDAFVEAYLKIGTLHESAALPGWLRTLTLNLCRMWFRRNKQRWTVLPDDVPAEPPVEQEDDPSLLARMAGGLSSLPAAQRLILVLHYFEGLSYDQLAEFLEVPPGTIMSRLYRARMTLRRILENPVPDEEPPMIEDDRFKQEVQAEINLLLEMFHQEPSAAERLAVILRHSPERLSNLLQQTDQPQQLENLALLLPRLGMAGASTVVDAAFSGSRPASDNAATVLRGFSAASRSIGVLGWHSNTPDIPMYLFLHALIEHPADAGLKAELLLEMLEATQDDAVAALLTCMFLCYRQPALDLLAERLRTIADPDDLHASSYVLYALCRTGTWFCEQLQALLLSGDPAAQLVALAGLEAVGRCLDLRWLVDATDQEYANEVRIRAKWPPLRSQDFDNSILTDIHAQVADLLTGPQPAVRNAALAALGHLKARSQVDRIAQYVSHEDATTCLAAIRALAELGHADAANALMHAAQHGQPAERRAAVEALGRRRVRHAQFLLLRLLDDPDAHVRQAAVTALGELGTDEATTALRNLLTSADRRLQKAAAKALSPYHSRPAHVPLQPRDSLAARIRNGAKPTAYSSIDTVLRYALPEIRPYDEQDLTRRIAAVCIDYSMTRRRLIDEGWMVREAGFYNLTDAGQAAWQVEQFVLKHYQQ